MLMNRAALFDGGRIPSINRMAIGPPETGWQSEPPETGWQSGPPDTGRPRARAGTHRSPREPRSGLPSRTNLGPTSVDRPSSLSASNVVKGWSFRAPAVTTREVEAGLLTPSLSFTPRSPPGSPRMTGWVREALDAFQVRTAEPVHPVRLSRPRAPTSSTLDAVNAIAVHVLAAAGMSRAGATLGLWGP